MEIRKGMRIYIKSSIGVSRASGYSGIVIRVTKKEGKIYSIRVEVDKSLTIEYGFEEINRMQTFRVGVTAYDFFMTPTVFKVAMHDAFTNIFKVISDVNQELKKF